MADDPNVTPIGARLGSERLYASGFPADDPGLLFGANPAKAASASSPPAAPTFPASAATRPAAWVSTLLELAGITTLALGCWLILPAVGLIVAGAALILLGIGMDRP
jgi:hypothetical protein